jgi:hypothetical protein
MGQSYHLHAGQELRGFKTFQLARNLMTIMTLLLSIEL